MQRKPLVAGMVLGVLLLGAGGGLGLRVQPQPAQRHVVTIRDFTFEPAHLTAAPGDTIVWVNQDLVPHTATRHDAAWDSGTLADTWYLVVRERGAQSYFCRFHPAMRGRFVVP